MGVIYAFSASRLGSGINAEDDADRLAPVSAFRIGVEQPKISREVSLVVVVDPLGQRGPSSLKGLLINISSRGLAPLAVEL